MPTYFVTGASRGLGLEFVRQLLASGDPRVQVIAAARDPASATELQALVKAETGRIETVKLDVSDPKSVEAGVAEVTKSSLAKEGIDYLLNNAGIFTGKYKTASEGLGRPIALTFRTVLGDEFFDWTRRTLEELGTCLKTNLFGTISVTQALLPLLRKGHEKKIWVVSSTVGSIGGPLSEGPHMAMYAISKAALNMYTRKLAIELRPENFTVIPFSPGYVKTDATEGLGDLSTDVSIKMSLKMLYARTPTDTGTFWDYTGESFSW